MNRGNVKFRLAKSKIVQIVIIILAFAITLPMIFIIFYISKEGITKINWTFLTRIPKPVGELGGGILNAIVGSLIIVVLGSIIAVPGGILCGIYLSENKTSRLSYWSRLTVDVLQGVPSIVIGIVVYYWLVKNSGSLGVWVISVVSAIIIMPYGILAGFFIRRNKVGFWNRLAVVALQFLPAITVGVVVYLVRRTAASSYSALSGSIALAIMMLPILVRSTEETLKLIPSTLKEAGLALGVPYHKVILRIIVPCGTSGILAGVILAIARIAGETAPLLFTALGDDHLVFNVLRPMHSLPLLIFNYANQPYDELHDLAWGAALILLVTVLLLNITTKIATRKWNVQL